VEHQKASQKPHLSITAGFGTLLSQVAGFHRAVPSTTLDKVFNFYAFIIAVFTDLSTIFLTLSHFLGI
jgi:hypothetical protein